MPRTASAPEETVETVEVLMTMTEAKKNSVRFDAPSPEEGGPRPAITAAYIGNDAWAALGSPDRIRLDIHRAPVE